MKLHVSLANLIHGHSLLTLCCSHCKGKLPRLIPSILTPVCSSSLSYLYDRIAVRSGAKIVLLSL